MANVTLKNLTKTYPGQVTAVDNLSLEIADGEFLVLVGPSGCGKSTALKMIAGLEPITAGEVLIADEVVNEYASRDRDIAMVFQSYALYPHMSVFDNIAFSLQIAKVPKAEITRRVGEVARILQLEDYLRRKPGNLSGGQRQRVAMGRAIIRQPSVFLMDEPLSNLDAKLRVQMRSEIAQIQRRVKVTTIYVTHDQVEAMTMGDRVALMKDGVLQQVDTPDNIYNRPANTFVASFIGSPSMNLYRARLEGEVASCTLVLGGNRLAIPASVFADRAELAAKIGADIIVGLRPEDLEDAALLPTHPADQRLAAHVILNESLGSDHMVHFPIDAPLAKVSDQDSLDEIVVAEGVCIGRFGARSLVKAGQSIEVAVACDRLHFFDAATGLAI
ncbi:sn-glycerol-3-phosphate ABC transporter ATP-binding protein UgpC [Devosia rhodophyticola]|uniref:Sn-glycerol-3-phosphate ABC transporter ATP-binding protein UgpC n=1 Tax=Devosia rhodophyticola TaxID=3026423 RepID=A0ABY7YYN1_9HYPH|nr:sn-glycerol-3-phosphate ABC transporter ATP-binding protein UgpC [Devosia rhodophyticola]WDR06498.1 sn-glycerol-3-phosphate ABC transporter ATP-binding protein UgpC [Devosia rhodophyticola]